MPRALPKEDNMDDMDEEIQMAIKMSLDMVWVKFSNFKLYINDFLWETNELA